MGISYGLYIYSIRYIGNGDKSIFIRLVFACIYAPSICSVMVDKDKVTCHFYPPTFYMKGSSSKSGLLSILAINSCR